MNKYKVGDKVRFKGETVGYNFKGSIGQAKKGTIVEISSVGEGPNPSYGVKGSYTGDDVNWNSMEKEFVLVKKGKVIPNTHIIVWDTSCGDPHMEGTHSEVKDKAKELLKEKNVIEDSIVIYKFSSKTKPKLVVKFA